MLKVVISSIVLWLISIPLLLIYAVYSVPFAILLFVLLAIVSYIVSRKIFVGFRTLKLLLCLIPLFLFLILLIGIDPFRSFVFSRATYCYDWGMGGVQYIGVWNKECVCDGSYIGSCPITAMCDKGQIRCRGKVVGAQYNYVGNNFFTLEQWEDYCSTLNEEMKNYCLNTLNRTKAAE